MAAQSSSIAKTSVDLNTAGRLYEAVYAQPARPSFPDYRDNYERTIAQPARKAAQRAADALAAQQAAELAYAAQTRATQRTVATNDAMLFIFERESGNNPTAVNPYSGACGLGQALPCSKLTAVCTLSDYGCQVQFFTTYAVSRYGGWTGAYNFWLSHNWW